MLPAFLNVEFLKVKTQMHLPLNVTIRRNGDIETYGKASNELLTRYRHTSSILQKRVQTCWSSSSA